MMPTAVPYGHRRRSSMRHGPIVYLLMSYGQAQEVSTYAAALAREHALVCFDPRGECLRP